MFRLTVRDITLIGMMVAVIEVCKAALSLWPNIELTTFWIIIFSLYLGNRIFFAIPVFILIEGAIYGFGLWWIMYLYMWPSLAILARLFKHMKSAFGWSILSGIYGLLFGFFCAIPYVVIGTVGNTLTNGIQAAFAWWISGIPWDLVHGIGNFCLMLVLYHPITSIMKKACRF